MSDERDSGDGSYEYAMKASLKTRLCMHSTYTRKGQIDINNKPLERCTAENVGWSYLAYLNN